MVRAGEHARRRRLGPLTSSRRLGPLTSSRRLGADDELRSDVPPYARLSGCPATAVSVVSMGLLTPTLTLALAA